MGVPCWRQRHDAVLDAQEESGVELLLGDFLLFRGDGDLLLLSADILPGCQGCIASAERSIPSAWYIGPNADSGGIWCAR